MISSEFVGIIVEYCAGLIKAEVCKKNRNNDSIEGPSSSERKTMGHR